MPITIFIEIAIGVVLVWLFVAIAAMATQEWLSNLLRWRASDLERTIRDMLADEDLAEQFYDHPLIRSLSMRSGFFARQLAKLVGQSSPRPSYIPDRTFALALFDVVVTAGTDDSVIDEMLNTWIARFQESLESLREEGRLPEEVSQALQEARERARKILQETPGHTQRVAKLRAVAQQTQAKIAAALGPDHPGLTALTEVGMPILDELPRYLGSAEVVSSLSNLATQNPTLSRTLNNLMSSALNYADQAQDVIAAYRTNVETWFNDVMDRLGGVYKRRAQWVAFLLGLALALVFNVDSVTVINELYREPTLRAAMVARAEHLDEIPSPEQAPELTESLQKLQTDLEMLGLPVGWTIALGTEPLCADLTQDQGGLAIPLGRVQGTEEATYRCLIAAGVAQDVPGNLALLWTSKVTGWLLSGAMAAQGAPFWFDMLNKLVNVRSSGKNPSEEK